MNNILLADTSDIFRAGIKTVLEKIYTQARYFEVESYEQLILFDTPKLDLLIVEHSPNFKTLELLKSRFIKNYTKVVVVSSQNNKSDLRQFLELNVFGYLLKQSPKSEWDQTFASVERGEKFFCPFVMDLLVNRKHDVPETINDLTPREVEITKLVSVGMKNKEIADQLNLSPHTIHTHRKNILRKTGVSSALELSLFAKENGLLE